MALIAKNTGNKITKYKVKNCRHYRKKGYKIGFYWIKFPYLRPDKKGNKKGNKILRLRIPVILPVVAQMRRPLWPTITKPLRGI